MYGRGICHVLKGQMETGVWLENVRKKDNLENKRRNLNNIKMDHTEFGLEHNDAIHVVKDVVKCWVF